MILLNPRRISEDFYIRTRRLWFSIVTVIFFCKWSKCLKLKISGFYLLGLPPLSLDNRIYAQVLPPMFRYSNEICRSLYSNILRNFE